MSDAESWTRSSLYGRTINYNDKKALSSNILAWKATDFGSNRLAGTPGLSKRQARNADAELWQSALIFGVALGARRHKNESLD
jgi:hypothetical protein